MPDTNQKIDRYHRQAILPQIGQTAQAKLGRSRVLIVGCGALGCHLADQLARAGAGWMRIADRDVVELSNLQRQTLFDEQDAKTGAAKAEAAAGRLRKVNSAIVIEPIVADVWAGNIADLIQADGKPVDLILDGTDNVQSRYLINDIAVQRGIPWVHAACVGIEGRVMPVVAGGACLRCVYPTPPAAGELPTCDTAGVLGAAAAITASLQAVHAIKILTGQPPAAEQRLSTVDVWSGRLSSVEVASAKTSDCPCCGKRQFPFLDTTGESAIALCGRNAVQIRPAKAWKPADFERACGRLDQFGPVERGVFFSRCRLNEPAGMMITCFRDGRLLIDGTADTGRAKAICARFIGT